ncbi:hypothetical protein, partial [Caldalkalibacillus thermarum]|uniref:hypothetical protein n=1 Tax=Caldalkalibacillus thermarum TaxID=296745 RepID=UPI001E4F3152
AYGGEGENIPSITSEQSLYNQLWYLMPNFLLPDGKNVILQKAHIISVKPVRFLSNKSKTGESTTR